jgi:hypothetical protein
MPVTLPDELLLSILRLSSSAPFDSRTQQDQYEEGVAYLVNTSRVSKQWKRVSLSIAFSYVKLDGGEFADDLASAVSQHGEHVKVLEVEDGTDQLEALAEGEYRRAFLPPHMLVFYSALVLQTYVVSTSAISTTPRSALPFHRSSKSPSSPSPCLQTK